MKAKLAVAMDFRSSQEFWNWVQKLRGKPLVLKLGLRLIPCLSPSDYQKIKDLGFDLFVDVKLHDIPTQMAEAAQTWSDLGADYLTIHLSAGPKALALTQQAISKSRTQLLGVSVLTSHSDSEWQSIGHGQDIKNTVSHWIQMGQASGLKGFVLSAHELPTSAPVDGICWCTPGLSLEAGSAAASDQSRVMHWRQARARGAKLLVMGRGLLGAADPLKAIDSVLEGLS